MRYCARFFLAILLADCAPSPAAEHSQIVALRDRIESLKVADNHDQQLQSEVRAATQILLRAQEDYLAAETKYQHAIRVGSAAESDYRAAIDNWQRAQQYYRAAAYVILVAGATDLVGKALCGSTMSTQQFRRKLALDGRPVQPNQDIDHIWPHARGGADHPWNYQVLPQSVNRSLGAGIWRKIETMPIATLRGLVVSALVHLGCN